MANKTTPLADQLAQELGYKSVKDMKQAMAGGGDFAGGVSSRLEQGTGFGTAFAGGASDVKEDIKRKMSIKGLGKKAYKEFFSGDDIFSAYMRGRLNKGEKKKETIGQTPDSDNTSPSKEGGGDFGAESVAVLNIIAKNSMSLPGMARDMNVLRQNLVKLVKLQPGGKEKARTGADAWFLREDERETALEVQKAKLMDKGRKPTGATPVKEEKGFLESILGNIMSFFGGGFMKAIASIFSPAMLLKAFTKLFLPAVLIGSLFNGIMDGWKKWQETGSLKEAIIAGLGGIVSFLTFGMFGEAEVKNAFTAIGNFIDPIVESIADTFDSLKMWVVNNVGIPEIKLGTIKNPFTDTVYNLGSIGPYYPFKKDTGSSAPEKSDRPQQKADAAAKKKAEEDAAKKTPDVKPETTTPSADSTKPTPEASKEDSSKVEKSDGTKIKIPSGVNYDTASGKFTYKNVSFNANNQDEMDNFVKAIDNKTVIEFQGKNSDGKPATITINGATGEKSLAPPKEEVASPTLLASADSGGPSGAPAMPAGGTSTPSLGADGGSSGAAPSAQAAAPSAEAAPSAPSGASLSSDSAMVAEGQRLDSAADAGVTINAPVTNNETKSQGKTPSLIADAWNRDFVDSYTVAV